MIRAKINPQALAAIRYMNSRAIGDNDALATLGYCEGNARRWADTPQVLLTAKAAVDALSTDNSSALAQVQATVSGFLEFVRPYTLLDRIANFRQIAANKSVLRIAGVVAASWVAQGAPRPIGQFSLERLTLQFAKATCTAVVTRDLVFAADPVSELACGRELGRGVGQFLNKAFLDPSLGPKPDVSPGSISHGLSPITSSGATLADVRFDFKRLFENFLARDGALESAVMAMAPKTALSLGMLTDSGGGLVFPNIGPRGGTILNIPVFTTSACAAGGSPGESFLVLFDPEQVLLADSGNIDATSAKHATVQMNDAPNAGAQNLVSLWANGLQAMSVEREIVWKRASDTGVSVMTDITY